KSMRWIRLVKTRSGCAIACSAICRSCVEMRIDLCVPLIFRAKKGLPPPLCGEGGTIGLRISAHPIAQLIVEAVETPLTSTSANPAGEGNLTDCQSIAHVFGDQVDLIIDGGKVPGIGSTVVDLTMTPPRVEREGMIKKPLLE
ncbi:MAG: Sua5/YciO/YrdC/YwlC family protein, partial [Deltaproteobacteria bacterium]